jgi:hypothetical protein
MVRRENLTEFGERSFIAQIKRQAMRSPYNGNYTLDYAAVVGQALRLPPRRTEAR